MDGWLTADWQYSYIFANTTVVRYSNFDDKEDRGDGFPKPISVAFPGVPDQQTDSDVGLGGTYWVVWKGAEVWKYHQYQKQIYPGYPKAIHDDAADGGVFGGRTHQMQRSDGSRDSDRIRARQVSRRAFRIDGLRG